MQQAGSPTAVLDAKWLTAEALQLSDIGLMRAEAEAVSPEAEARLAGFMARRLAGQSVARIIGEREFYGLAFTLNAATLEPRPDTELLVDLAIKALPQDGLMLDLGTGTGCIPIAVLVSRPDASGVAVDLSGEALVAARHNARRHEVAERLTFLQGSWFEPLSISRPGDELSTSGPDGQVSTSRPHGELVEPRGRADDGATTTSFDRLRMRSTVETPAMASEGEPKFHLIASNPPYIASAVIPTLSPEVQNFDPALALDGGPDGLAPYRIIIAQAPRHLLPGGMILLEIGYDQGAAVTALLADAGFVDIVIHKDFGGLDRVASAHHI